MLKGRERQGHIVVVILAGVVLVISLYTKLWFYVGWAVVAGATSHHHLTKKK